MTTASMREARVLIDNETSETEMSEVRNPARTSEVVGLVARGTAADVERAIASAERAGAAWAALSTEQRGALMATAVEEWNETHLERARLLTREQGKVLWESLADCRGPVLITEYFIGKAPSVLAEERIEDARGTIVKRQLPYGVTSIIVPWNTPVYLSFQHIAPALISGNTVIVKTPENAPLSLHWALQILADKLPSGVLNVVPGSGSEVGSLLASHPKVRKVLFTGSLPVGRSILSAAAPTIKSVGLELGGNDPAIVLPDFAMSDEAMREIVLGTFTLTGQICFSIKRIYVPEGMLEAFTERFAAAVDQIRVGEGLDARSTIGPVNNGKEFDRLQRLLADVRASGATVRELGQKVDPESWSDGYFMLPHVVTDIDPAHELVQEEQFGPIVPIIGYSDLDALIDAVNESEFGLGASIWTEDEGRGFETGRRVSAGTVFVNVHRMGASDMTLPFGGTKQSGLGRTHGAEVLLECVEPQVIVKRVDTERFPGAHLAQGLFENADEAEPER